MGSASFRPSGLSIGVMPANTIYWHLWASRGRKLFSIDIKGGLRELLPLELL